MDRKAQENADLECEALDELSRLTTNEVMDKPESADNRNRSGNDARRKPRKKGPAKSNGAKTERERDGRRILLVARESRVKNVAGSIARTTRESGPPILSAVGPASVNQAVKAIAVARSYLESDGIDLVVEISRKPQNDIKDVIEFSLIKVPINAAPTGEFQDLKSAAKSMTKSLGGAIANNVRENKIPRITAIGQKPVFRAVTSIVQARTYLSKDGVDIRAAPKFIEVTFENGQEGNAIQFTISSIKN